MYDVLVTHLRSSIWLNKGNQLAFMFYTDASYILSLHKGNKLAIFLNTFTFYIDATYVLLLHKGKKLAGIVLAFMVHTDAH